MLDAAEITTGSAVLDVAAGAGGQSLAAARRVGPLGPRARHRHLPGDPRPRRGGRGRGRADQRRHQGAGRGTPRRRRGRVRRGDLPARADLPPRPARGARRPVPGAAARWPGRRDRLRHRRPQRLLLRSGVDHPAAGAAAARLRQASPGPFSLGAPGVLEDALRAAGFRDVGSQHGRRTAADAVRRRLRPLRARVLRRPAPDARGPRLPTSASRPGRRSVPSWPGSRRRTALQAPAS